MSFAQFSQRGCRALRSFVEVLLPTFTRTEVRVLVPWRNMGGIGETYGANHYTAAPIRRHSDARMVHIYTVRIYVKKTLNCRRPLGITHA